MVFWIKTFTSNVYIGAETLYKPEGRPSFELLSYIIDSDLDVVGKVLGESAIDPNDVFACGDLKSIYSAKLHQAVEVRRINKESN